MPQKANITVFLQALGAHYLGAHACDVANIHINLKYSGGDVNIPYPVMPNFTDDGNTSLHFVSGASSFMPIISIPQPPPAAAQTPPKTQNPAHHAPAPP